MQYDLLNILTPFLMKSVEKWGSAAQKLIFEVGGLRKIMKSAFFANFDGFISYWDHFWVLMYGFWVNKSIPAV